ncbi:MAG: hypothetical protein ACK4ME_01465 [Fimbriimonadales bacterium]
MPRTFWFVQLQPTQLGYNPQLPPLETDPRALREAKAPYKDIPFEGQVEARFLYGTLLSSDLLPFGHLPLRMVVLPIIPSASGYELLTAEAAREQGYLKLAQWLERAESEWNRLRGSKSDRYTLIEWINHRRNLTLQSPTARYRVLYPDVNRIMTACVVELSPARLSGVVVDTTCYFCETDDELEAYYLCSLLNTPMIDERLGALRRKAQKTHPHVHKKIFDVAVFPLYDANDAKHRELAE